VLSALHHYCCCPAGRWECLLQLVTCLMVLWLCSEHHIVRRLTAAVFLVQHQPVLLVLLCRALECLLRLVTCLMEAEAAYSSAMSAAAKAAAAGPLAAPADSGGLASAVEGLVQLPAAAAAGHRQLYLELQVGPGLFVLRGAAAGITSGWWCTRAWLMWPDTADMQYKCVCSSCIGSALFGPWCCWGWL
jgi:hypothetical protein